MNAYRLLLLLSHVIAITWLEGLAWRFGSIEDETHRLGALQSSRTMRMLRGESPAEDWPS